MRRARGLTQEQVAARLDVSTKYYQRIERGTQNLTLETLGRIGMVLAVAPHALLEPPRASTVRRGRPRRTEAPVKLGPSTAFVVVDERGAGAVPLLSLAAAGGSKGETGLAETSAWVIPATQRRIRARMFVARVIGCSMAPKIPDGAFCLFDAGAVGRPDGGIYLVEHRGEIDPETSSHFTVKRVEVVAASGRRRQKLRLSSVAPDHPPVDLDPGPPSDPSVRLVARLIEVLGSPDGKRL